ncbi:crAss001_48 related protein [Parvimonas micra]
MILDELYREYNRLDIKIMQMQKNFKERDIERQERQLLITQLEYMKGYRELLNRRINFTKKKYKL